MFQLWFGGFSREGGEGGRRQPCRGEDFINSDRFIFQTFYGPYQPSPQILWHRKPLKTFKFGELCVVV